MKTALYNSTFTTSKIYSALKILLQRPGFVWFLRIKDTIAIEMFSLPLSCTYPSIPFCNIFPYLEHCWPLSCLLTLFPSGIGMQKKPWKWDSAEQEIPIVLKKKTFSVGLRLVLSFLFSLPCQCQMKGRLLVIITPLNSQNRIEKLCREQVGSK